LGGGNVGGGGRRIGKNAKFGKVCPNCFKRVIILKEQKGKADRKKKTEEGKQVYGKRGTK